jgi:sirohydrochlorin ferrochelatase
MHVSDYRLPSLPFPSNRLGVVIVDHGSRRDASNAALLDVVDLFRRQTGLTLVEPAHMELAEPTIDVAFSRLVAQGAAFVVVHPYFLLPGRHWDEDIPRLAALAAGRHPEIDYLVTAPLGIHSLMVSIMFERIGACLSHYSGDAAACSMCQRERATVPSATTSVPNSVQGKCFHPGSKPERLRS